MTDEREKCEQLTREKALRALGEWAADQAEIRHLTNRIEELETALNLKRDDDDRRSMSLEYNVKALQKADSKIIELDAELNVLREDNARLASLSC